MCKFNVGDRIRATKKANEKYTITNEKNEWKGIVIDIIDNNLIYVKTTHYSNCTPIECGKFLVSPHYFELKSKRQRQIEEYSNV